MKKIVKYVPISYKRKNELKEFLKKVKIKVQNYELLSFALTHKSYVNENYKNNNNNEKLEFLGDSVLGLVITDYLFKTYIDLVEGDLARIKSSVVSEKSLHKIALSINLNKYLLIGKGEELTGGREKKAILADSFEAFLGAVYLDMKYPKVEKLILQLFKREIDLVVNNEQGLDYKTLLQEFAQKKFKQCPEYSLLRETGPEHNKIFYMSVSINNKIIAKGSGRSKKDAEKSAAKIAYDKYSKEIKENQG